MSLQAKSINLMLGDGDARVKAVDNVSFDVSDGDLVAVVGPSGSGKSSLLAVCGGLRKPTSGTILIGGRDITALTEKDLTKLRRDHIGFVFQFSNLVPSLNAVDQLLLTRHLSGRRPNQKDKERAVSLLNEVGLGAKTNSRPGQLSGGERQRVGIARALMTDPDILLIDEPTSMLDQKRGREIIEQLKQTIKDHQIATLMATHDTSMLDAADAVLTMADGRLTTGKEFAHA